MAATVAGAQARVCWTLPVLSQGALTRRLSLPAPTLLKVALAWPKGALALASIPVVLWAVEAAECAD